MNGDSIACQNLSLEYKALASRQIYSKDPTINERQYRIAKEIMDIANYLSKSASLIESCEHKQSAWKPGKVNLIKYTNLNLVSQLTKQSRYSYGSIRYTKSFKEWNKNYTDKELEVMITSIFNVFEKNNIKSFRELKKLKWNQIVGMINEVNDIDEETKKLYSETIKDLIWLNNKK